MLFFEIDEDMVQMLLMLKVLFPQESEVIYLFCGASPGSEPSLFFRNISSPSSGYPVLFRFLQGLLNPLVIFSVFFHSFFLYSLFFISLLSSQRSRTSLVTQGFLCDIPSKNFVLCHVNRPFRPMPVLIVL